MTLLDIPGIQNFEQDYTTNFLKDVLDSAANGIIITDYASTVQYVNPCFLKIFKCCSSEQLLGKNAAGLFVQDRVREFDDVRCIVQSCGDHIGEAVLEYQDGTILQVEVSFSEAMDKQGRILGKMASFVDISKRKHAEQKLRESEEQLRSLSRKTIEFLENERKLVAKELHDSVGGNPAAIKFALEEKLEHMAGSPPAEVISLEKIVDNITDTITEVRRISNHLMPSMLEDIGLVATIRTFCREQRNFYPHARIITQLLANEENIPDLLKITIFRLVQESLNNAFKHAEPDTIEVSLRNPAIA